MNDFRLVFTKERKWTSGYLLKSSAILEDLKSLSQAHGHAQKHKHILRFILSPISPDIWHILLSNFVNLVVLRWLKDYHLRIPSLSSFYRYFSDLQPLFIVKSVRRTNSEGDTTFYPTAPDLFTADSLDKTPTHQHQLCINSVHGHFV